MKIYLREQSSRFKEHLDRLMATPVMVYDKAQLKERTSGIIINNRKPLRLLDAHSLFDYTIFPPDIMTALTQWQAEGRGMAIGDTIVQQAYLPPFPYISQKLVFGVRICEIINEADRIGFSYETLEGHVEKGVSTFLLEETSAGVVFKIHTFSGSGTIIGRLLGPISSIPYQGYCTRRALAYVKDQLNEAS